MNKINCLIVLLILTQLGWSQTVNIKDFGAVPDGKTINTAAIQLAIDKCHTEGGGEVIVPAGVFYSGTIFLKSNVFLNLMPGGVLQGSYNAADYPEHDILSPKSLAPLPTMVNG